MPIQWPIYNWAAEGNVVRSQANLLGISIGKENLARNIRSDIAVATSNLNNAHAQLKQAKAAAESIRIAHQNEKKKQKLGMSTSIDVLLIQTQLTNAAVNEIVTHSNDASALVRLRFATARHRQAASYPPPSRRRSLASRNARALGLCQAPASCKSIAWNRLDTASVHCPVLGQANERLAARPIGREAHRFAHSLVHAFCG